MDTPDSVNPWEASQAQMAAFVQNLPQLLEAYRNEIAPTAEAQAGADVANAGKYAENQARLYEMWAPILAQVGREQYSADQLNAARTEADIARQYGSSLVGQADKFQRQLDPEFYRNRSEVAAGQRRLLGAMDPTQLSGSEREEVSRALGRQGFGANDDLLKATSDAMTFGSALQNKQSAYGAILNSVASSLPTLKSGITGFEVATRRPLTSNSGQSQFIGTQMGLGNQGQGLAQGFLGNIGGYTGQWIGNEANLGRNVWDQIGSGVGLIGSLAGGLAMCWIAREVYGAENPLWMKFRCWLMKESPNWLFNWYLNNGERVAAEIHHRPIVKRVIRFFMNLVTR